MKFRPSFTLILLASLLAALLGQGISSSQAQTLIAAAQQIQAVLAC